MEQITANKIKTHTLLEINKQKRKVLIIRNKGQDIDRD